MIINRKQEQLKRQENELKRAKQSSLQIKASWEFLGGNNSQLYLLDDSHLREIAEQKGLLLIIIIILIFYNYDLIIGFIIVNSIINAFTVFYIYSKI